MPGRASVVVRGEPGTARGVGRLLALALEAEGAAVEPGRGVPLPVGRCGDLRGVRVELSVKDSGDEGAGATARYDAEPSGRSVGAAVRLALGVLAVVVLLGVEVRLRLGLRAALLSAAVGAWALWRSHVPGRGSRAGAS